MMKTKNENGYALVTVLIVITVFMVVFLSFMGQAFSSVKQNQVVEKSSQSLAIAEMGVTYYKVATQNTFETNRSEVNQRVNEALNLLPSNYDPNVAKEETVKATAEIIKEELSLEEPKVYVEGYPDAYFSISNINTTVVTDSDKVEVLYTVTGTEDGKHTALKANMGIDLSSIIINGEFINFVLPAFDEVPKPQRGCTTFSNGRNELLLENSSNDLPGKTDNNGNNNGLSDKIVYATGALNVNGNANNSYNLKIHSDNNFNITKNMTSATKLTLETKKNATFEGNLKVDSSRILIGENLVNGKNLELNNGSFAFIGGSATFEKLDIKNNSTMCVQGLLTVPEYQKNIDSTSKLIVKSIVGAEEFERQCGSPTSINLSINWGQNIETKVDKVDYK